MSQPKNEITDHVSLMFFKDNYAARTFDVPLSWIRRFGILLGGLFFVTVISLTLAIRFHIALRRASPERVQELELELNDLRTVVAGGSVKAAAPPQPSASLEAALGAALATPGATPLASPSLDAAETSMPSTAMTPPLAPSVLNKAYLFSALPLHTENLSEKKPVSIALHSPKVTWQGKILNVNFNIQYHAEDKGNQQGRIVILVRGPETLMAYPDGVFNRSGSSELIVPKRGEYFSVSRFREVRAKFGPVKSQDLIKEVEVLLLTEEGQILVYQNLIPQAPVSTRQKVETPSGVPSPAVQEEGGSE